MYCDVHTARDFITPLSDDHLCCQTSIRLPSVSPGNHGAAGLQARQGHPPVRPARHRQDPHGPPDRSDA